MGEPLLHVQAEGDVCTGVERLPSIVLGSSIAFSSRQIVRPNRFGDCNFPLQSVGGGWENNDRAMDGPRAGAATASNASLVQVSPSKTMSQ